MLLRAGKTNYVFASLESPSLVLDHRYNLKKRKLRDQNKEAILMKFIFVLFLPDSFVMAFKHSLLLNEINVSFFKFSKDLFFKGSYFEIAVLKMVYLMHFIKLLLS